VLVRLRLSVPDRPGSLGLVATALGSAGADIVRLEVLDSEGGRVDDDLFLEVADEDQLGRVLNRLGSLAGVSVGGVQHPAPPVAGHAELELVGRLVARPGNALQTLVDGAPAAFGADWGALVEYGPAGDPGGVVATSVHAPGKEAVALTVPLRLAAVTMTPPGRDQPYGGTALVPVGREPVGLVLVRETGPSFHRTELWRLAQLCELVGATVTRS